MTVVDAHAARPQVEIGGRLSRELAELVGRVTVESQRHLPTMCSIEFSDPYREVIDERRLTPGAPVSVRAASAEQDSGSLVPDELFDGEVVAVEAVMAYGVSKVVVRAYDRGHRLHRSRHSRTWLNQSDSDVLNTIAGEHGLRADARPSAGTHEYLCQHLQTDWEFLVERAAEIGYELALDGATLGYRPLGAAAGFGRTPELELGSNLLRFQPRVSSAEQAGQTSYNGWDPVRAQAFSGSESAAPENAPGATAFTATRIAEDFDRPTDVAARPVVADQSAADRLATGRRAHSMGLAFEADGQCFGDPALRAGAEVTVEGVGRRFGGTYVLSTVTHVFDEDGFTTTFSINGRHDRSLFGLTSRGAGTAGVAGSHLQSGAASLSEVALAMVTNTNDPDDLGRVKVTMPWLGTDIESTWAPVIAAGGGSGGGWQLQPEINDQVLVAFGHGDVRRPYVLGGVWNERHPPAEPGAVVDGRTEKRVFTTREGHRLLFDDSSQARRIQLRTAGGVRLEMSDDDEPTITLSDGDGDANTIVIDGQQGTVTVTASGDMKLAAGGNLRLEAAANLDIEAGANLTLTSRSALTAEGAGPVKIRSSSSAELDGGASTTVKAAGMLTVRGAPVRIN